MRRVSKLDVMFWGLTTAGSLVLTGFAGYELVCVASRAQSKTISSRAQLTIVQHRPTSFIITVAASYIAGLITNHFWESRNNNDSVKRNTEAKATSSV